MSFKIFHIESHRIIYTEFRAFLLLSCYFWELNEKMGVPLDVPLSFHSHLKSIQFPYLLFTDRIELVENIETETFCLEKLGIPVFRTFLLVGSPSYIIFQFAIHPTFLILRMNCKQP